MAHGSMCAHMSNAGRVRRVADGSSSCEGVQRLGIHDPPRVFLHAVDHCPNMPGARWAGTLEGGVDFGIDGIIKMLENGVTSDTVEEVVSIALEHGPWNMHEAARKARAARNAEYMWLILLVRNKTKSKESRLGKPEKLALGSQES